MSTSLSICTNGGVTRVTLNRPHVRNALDDRLIGELTDWARGAARDEGLRVAVLAGEGRTFSAGADLGWMARMVDYSEEENRRDARALADMFAALDTLPVPLIGRVQGAALGGGVGLAAVCDVVVSSQDAQFGFTEVKLGIIPAVISPYCVAKIGVSASRELMLTGARFGAARAKEIGLVHAVVPADDLDAAVDTYVREVLSSAPAAVRAVKRLIPQVAGRRPGEVADLTSREIAARRVSPEGQEGLRAFLGKGAPSWAR
jgi:methylglutaconyl-CoA hydratase